MRKELQEREVCSSAKEEDLLDIKETIQNALGSSADILVVSNQLNEIKSYAKKLATFIRLIDLLQKRLSLDEQKSCFSELRNKLLRALEGLSDQVDDLSEDIRKQIKGAIKTESENKMRE